ncbi:hypothetical protein, partial [Oleiphilus sp. HI0067]
MKKIPMIKSAVSASVLVSALGLTACGGGGGGGSSAGSTGPAVGTDAYVSANLELKGDFSEDVTLIAGQTYRIDGEVN